jgi:hypothetical protein
VDGTRFRKFFIVILLRDFISAIILLETSLIILFFLARNNGKCNTSFENIGFKYRISYA